ncbi:MAG: hypothetical protein ACI309_01275 [Candidatus Limisoma sp.]
MENIQNAEKQDFVVVLMVIDMDSIVDQMCAECSYLERLSEERPPHAVTADDRPLLALYVDSAICEIALKLAAYVDPSFVSPAPDSKCLPLRIPLACEYMEMLIHTNLESAVVAHAFSRLYKPSGKVAEFYEHRFLSLICRIRRCLCPPTL